MKGISGYSDRQWHCGLRHASKRYTSRSLVLLHGYTMLSVSAIHNAKNLGVLFHSRHLKLLVNQQARTRSNAVSANFVPVVAVTKQKATPSIEFSTARGNFEQAKEVDDTLWYLLQPYTGLEEQDSQE